MAAAANPTGLNWLMLPVASNPKAYTTNENDPGNATLKALSFRVLHECRLCSLRTVAMAATHGVYSKNKGQECHRGYRREQHGEIYSFTHYLGEGGYHAFLAIKPVIRAVDTRQSPIAERGRKAAL